jgi:hypothetical protein
VRAVLRNLRAGLAEGQPSRLVRQQANKNDFLRCVYTDYATRLSQEISSCVAAYTSSRTLGACACTMGRHKTYAKRAQILRNAAAIDEREDNYAGAPIHVLYNDVLAIVFEVLLRDSPYLRISVRTVCRHWHRLVRSAHTPSYTLVRAPSYPSSYMLVYTSMPAPTHTLNAIARNDDREFLEWYSDSVGSLIESTGRLHYLRSIATGYGSERVLEWCRMRTEPPTELRRTIQPQLTCSTVYDFRVTPGICIFRRQSGDTPSARGRVSYKLCV